MRLNIRILDKTKRCNKRCSSCQYWKEAANNINYNFCNNDNSNEYGKVKHYWNYCKCFVWAENIIDKNDISNCEHAECIPLTLNDNPIPLCMYYFKVQRKDGKYWNHFPMCLDKHCPIKHPELLCGEDPL